MHLTEAWGDKTNSTSCVSWFEWLSGLVTCTSLRLGGDKTNSTSCVSWFEWLSGLVTCTSLRLGGDKTNSTSCVSWFEWLSGLVTCTSLRLGGDKTNSTSCVSWFEWLSGLVTRASKVVVHGSTALAAATAVVLGEGGAVGDLGLSILAVSTSTRISTFCVADGLCSLLSVNSSRCSNSFHCYHLILGFSYK